MPFVGKVFALARVTVHPLGLWASSHFDFQVYCKRADVLALGLFCRVAYATTAPNPRLRVSYRLQSIVCRVRNLLQT